jgi:hypothetical protein
VNCILWLFQNISLILPSNVICTLDTLMAIPKVIRLGFSHNEGLFSNILPMLVPYYFALLPKLSPFATT